MPLNHDSRRRCWSDSPSLVPAVIRSFVYTWQSVFKNGIVDHDLKELLRLRVATSLDCQY
jgi:hypothetical protein